MKMHKREVYTITIDREDLWLIDRAIAVALDDGKGPRLEDAQWRRIEELKVKIENAL